MDENLARLADMRCPGCGARKRTTSKSCQVCEGKFGSKFGELAERIRKDAAFKKACCLSLITEMGRMEFISMFGEVV